MMPVRLIVILALLVAAGCSCMQDDKPLTERDIRGHVVLEAYSVDLSWGYSLRGMYIDGDGVVWSYEHTGTPWYPERFKAADLYARDLLAKHKGAKEIGTVDRRLLLDMAQMIAPAAKGTVTHSASLPQESGALDVAYQYDAENDSYKEVILAGRGDKTATNSAPEAKTLLDYLRQVQRTVGWQ